MHKKISIRCDGSPEIGLGHVVRCISLAHMLTIKFSIHFYVLEIPDSLKNEIIHNGWKITILDNETIFFKSLTGNEIVVLDGYHFDSDYQTKIKNKGCKLVYIDDLQDQHFYADIVINHAPIVNKMFYDGESYTKYLLGPDYALLRPEFLNKKSQPEKSNKTSIKKVFICFGGSDLKNLTSKILYWLPKKKYVVTIIVGSSFMHFKELYRVIEERNDLKTSLKTSLSAEEICIELTNADLAIVPASGILYEAICINLPLISGYYLETQYNFYKAIKKEDVFYDASNFNKQNFLNALNIAENNQTVIQSNNQLNMIDRKSNERIIKEFIILATE